MRETTIDQLAAALDQGAAVIDVREPAEFREGHVPGAINIPMDQLFARLGEVDRDRSVHMVCASGNRSGAMTEVLTANGFDAINVAGGTNAWIRSGRPIAK
ncbi:rhodanese-like domain-containing protein [Nocardioides sp.]|uniref:rhodanese-like domain-containing protein n=1 Tax=Nocardioides sp. TaxID=35761 RepID=UPI00199F54E0|nr:rhodanese-like domain-containing protein [Nocardioides sp.]MBC7278835.1 rhodanese-like domain-containing protein [Nocardioides sp.]